MTIHEIILAMEWCSAIETTKADDRLLLITTKSHLQEVHTWLDTNLELVFSKHLPKNIFTNYSTPN